uniref:Uncharacterized protein n=1 Tax=Romanomermis culicivorax TaxID=13658 RepID=A0A915HFH8_ROMCU
MEIVESESETQPDLEKLTKQIKEMKEKIEILEKEKYGKAANELAKQLENTNAEEEGTSEEPYVEVVSEVSSDEEDSGANVLPAPPVYAKAGGQNVENITNTEKFAKVMHKKRRAKEERIAQEENKAELDKVKSGNFQQPARNPNDNLKYRRGLGKRGQVLNKALKEGKVDDNSAPVEIIRSRCVGLRLFIYEIVPIAENSSEFRGIPLSGPPLRYDETTP